MFSRISHFGYNNYFPCLCAGLGVDIFLSKSFHQMSLNSSFFLLLVQHFGHQWLVRRPPGLKGMCHYAEVKWLGCEKCVKTPPKPFPRSHNDSLLGPEKFVFLILSSLFTECATLQHPARAPRAEHWLRGLMRCFAYWLRFWASFSTLRACVCVCVCVGGGVWVWVWVCGWDRRLHFFL